MKRLFFILFLLLSLAFSILAQTAQSTQAKIVDKFGTYQCEDIKTRVLTFHLDLAQKPKAKGIVIIYEGKYAKYVNDRNGKSTVKYILPTFGESVFRTREMQKVLEFYKLPTDNILFIDGGFRENFEVEFWLVPNGAAFPKPTPTLEAMQYRKGAPSEIECGGS